MREICFGDRLGGYKDWKAVERLAAMCELWILF